MECLKGLLKGQHLALARTADCLRGPLRRFKIRRWHFKRSKMRQGVLSGSIPNVECSVRLNLSRQYITRANEGGKMHKVERNGEAPVRLFGKGPKKKNEKRKISNYMTCHMQNSWPEKQFYLSMWNSKKPVLGIP